MMMELQVRMTPETQPDLRLRGSSTGSAGEGYGRASVSGGAGWVRVPLRSASRSDRRRFA
jgi:hypothetical protein